MIRLETKCSPRVALSQGRRQHQSATFGLMAFAFLGLPRMFPRGPRIESVTSILFQSASALASGRFARFRCSSPSHRFNPRPPSRADDLTTCKPVPEIPVSIRVRPRERTIGSGQIRLYDSGFQSASALASGRSCSPRSLPQLLMFQSASALASGRSKKTNAVAPVHKFQSASALASGRFKSASQNLNRNWFQSASALASGRFDTL